MEVSIQIVACRTEGISISEKEGMINSNWVGGNGHGKQHARPYCIQTCLRLLYYVYIPSVCALNINSRVNSSFHCQFDSESSTLMLRILNLVVQQKDPKYPDKSADPSVP